MADHNVRVNVSTSADTSAVDKMKKSLVSVQQQIDVLVAHTGLLKSNNELLAQTWNELDEKTKAFQKDLATLQQGTEEYETKNKALTETIELQNKTYSDLRKNRTEIASNERMINALQNEVNSHSAITDEINKESSAMNWWKLSREDYIKWVEEWTKKSHDAREALIKLRQSWTASDEELKKANNNLLIARRNLKEYKQWLKESTDQLWFFEGSLVKVNKKFKEQFALAAAKKLLWLSTQLFTYVSEQLVKQWLELDKVDRQFSILTQRVGQNANEMRNAMRTASLWLITDVDAMWSANKALELWVVKTTQDMETLMKIATVRGREMWESITKAFDDIVVWLWRMSPRILDNLWIIVSEKDAYEKYAESIWKTTEELSKAEKQQAMFNAVVEASKTHLEQWEHINLSISEKLTVLKNTILNTFATVWVKIVQAFEPAIDKIIKWINELNEIWWEVETEWEERMNAFGDFAGVWVDECIENLKVMLDMVIDLSSFVFDTVWEALKWFWELYDYILGLMWADTSDTLNWIAGDWTDLVYFFRLGAATVYAVAKGTLVWIKWLFSALWSNIWTIIWYLTGNFESAWNWIKYGAVSMAQSALDSVVSMVNWIIEKWQDLKFTLWLADRMFNAATDWISTIDIFAKLWMDKNWLDWAKQTWEQFTEDLAEPRKQARDDIWDAMEEWYNRIEDIYVNRVGQLEERAYKVEKKRSDRASSLTLPSETTTWWGWSSKSWKSKKDEELEALKKEMQEYAKETERLKKEKDKWLKSLDDFARDKLKDQAKLIDDLWDEYEKKFKEIQKNIDDTEKAIEKLNEEIAELKQKMADLKIDENKSIAKEVVSARKELKALQEQYEWLKEVAESVSMEDLEWKWWVGKYDVDLIKKYKQYQDELDWLYTWMSDAEKQALDKEIEYAEWYDSLNGIEKIREDYRIRQEEIQKELDEKINALNVEQATLRAYKKEQQKLQDEWLKRIEEETAKYKDMYDKVQAFEKQYMDRIEADHWKQIAMTEQLIEQWNAVYRAKQRALSWWSDWARANWWPVSVWKSYIVWEKWPELFIPNSNWRIVSNDDMKGWGIEITVNMGGVSVWNDVEVESMAQRVSDIILRDIQLYKKWIR